MRGHCLLPTAGEDDGKDDVDGGYDDDADNHDDDVDDDDDDDGDEDDDDDGGDHLGELNQPGVGAKGRCSSLPSAERLLLSTN